MNKNNMVSELTQAYIQSYMMALDELHNPQLAVQVAMGVTTVYGNLAKNHHAPGADAFAQMIFSAMAQTKKKQPPEKEGDQDENG